MALKDLLTDLSNFKYTDYENAGANNSQTAGRHGGTEPLGQPPHPTEHSLYDDGVGGLGNPQTFTVRGHTVSDIISGRHGGTAGPTPSQPPHPDNHSEFDNGVGFGVAPSDNPQSFDVRGYTITGNKRFYIGWQGDIMNHPLSDYGIGAFDTISGVFDHTQTRDKLRKVYSNYPELTFGADIDGGINGLNGSIHIGNQDLPEVVGGGVTYYGNLNSITPRGSIYRAGDGTYRVPQSGHTTNPPGVTTQYPSNIPTFDGTQITHNIPQITLSGPFIDTYQSTLTDGTNGTWENPNVPNAHGSDFMTTPIGESALPTNSVTHIVDMITLSGPTTQPYHTTLNTTPISSGAHGSDFQTTPIEAYSSIFATQDGLLMNSIYDSGFKRGDMYMNHSPITSTPIFKDFTQSDKSLKPSSQWDPQKYGSNFVDTQYTFFGGEEKEFEFDDRIPYNIPARDNNVIGFDQPFILKDIDDRWGPGKLGAIDEGLFRGGVVTSVARTVADVFRLGKFILTPTGIMFGLKQFGLQLLNPRTETRIWNPLSLGSVAPIVHVDRHLGGGTYEDAIDKDGWDSDGFGSILDGYADAVISPVPSVGLTFTTGRRLTLAHTLAMVPSMGGKMALPGIPELKWSDFPVGNIDSLSKNIVGENKYRAKDGLGNKEYTTTDGTSIIPARNPEAGFSGGLFASRYAGSQLTQMFLSEDGLFPSEALTDAVLKTDIFAGNIYQPGTGTRGTYTKNFVFHGTGEDGFKNLGLAESIFDTDIIRKTSQNETSPGVKKNTLFYNIGMGPTIQSGDGHIEGLGSSVDYPGGDYIYKTGIFNGDLYNKDNKYTKNIGIDETQSSPLTKTRLRIDGDKDPVVHIQTAHFNTARFNVDGKSTLEKSIKLQNFPLFNNQSGGNLGSEKQALGFIDESGTPIQLADSLYGHQWNAGKRGNLTFKDGYEKSIKSNVETAGGTSDVVVDKGRFGLSDKNIPQVIKKLFTKNINTDGNIKLGDNEVEATFPANEKISTGDINRYKTLAYGDIPKSAEVNKKYGGKTEKTEDGGQYHSTKKDGKWIGQGKDLPPTGVYQIDSEGKLGLVKKGNDGEYMYGTKTGIGEPDSVNMTKYGEDGGDKVHGGPNFYPDDYIKFKFYDIVNKKNIIFRAFLSGISETFSPEWSSEKYIGRPDSVHVYQGVERSMSFEFMIVPSSKQELPILWEKLNYLVGFTYPTWKPQGSSGKRMEAPFMNLTLGDMYNAVPGYLSSLSITVDDNSPWEIDEGLQLPHAINVSCEFTHIGQHALASQGTHYDFGGKDKTWLKPYNVKDGTLGARKELTELFL